MASLVDITAATNTLRLNDKRQSEAQFTVFNASGRVFRGRVLVVPQNPISSGWLTIDGPAEEDFVIAGTRQYVVRVSVPPTAPAGSYPFRLDVLDVDLPDENLTQGPTVTFEVPAPEPPKKGLPIWIPIAIIVAVLVVGGVIAALVVPHIIVPDATPTPVPTMTNTPTATPTSTDTPTAIPTSTDTPTAIPPFEVTSIDISHSPVLEPGRRICANFTVTFRAEVTFTGSGTATYSWSGFVSGSGSLPVNCGSSPCTVTVPSASKVLNVPLNSERSVTASLHIDATTGKDGRDDETYICGTAP